MSCKRDKVMLWFFKGNSTLIIFGVRNKSFKIMKYQLVFNILNQILSKVSYRLDFCGVVDFFTNSFDKM